MAVDRRDRRARRQQQAGSAHQGHRHHTLGWLMVGGGGLIAAGAISGGFGFCPAGLCNLAGSCPNCQAKVLGLPPILPVAALTGGGLFLALR